MPRSVVQRDARPDVEHVPLEGLVVEAGWLQVVLHVQVLVDAGGKTPECVLQFILVAPDWHVCMLSVRAFVFLPPALFEDLTSINEVLHATGVVVV